ncbi:hypothetical protein GCM10022384_62910 [Streptomyces marokkonensis]|uniref:Uncharacterized protein n=1 Tax=Streptomyces marokkonensis TaxID=324855 RepID=A0ABP7SA20_9ACTN
MPSPARGRFFMSLNASTREMSASRPESTACPIPAEASTTTDSAVTARTAQRGLFRRTGGLGGRRDGRAPPGRGGGPPRGDAAGTRGERGGVGKVAPPRGRAERPDVGSVSTVGPYDLLPGAATPAARTLVPRSR